MTNDTEPRVRDALAALARRGGAPDDITAWERITAAVDDDRRSTARRRALFATAGLALVGSAAAVLALVATGDEPRQSVRVVSPATSPTTDEAPSPTVTEPPAPTVTEPTTVPHTGPTVSDQPADPFEDVEVSAASGPVPAHPMAAVVGADGGQYYIRVYDGDTGEAIATPVGSTIHGYRDLSFGPDGSLWFAEEFGDTSAVTLVRWGSTEKETPFGTETLAPAVSPDGTTLAYAHYGVTVERSSIRFVDLATGEQTAELFWRDDDPDFFHTNGGLAHLQWSPDGERLLFVSEYEGSEVLVIDPDAASLSEATPLVDGYAADVEWAADGRVVRIDDCCYPEHERWEVRVHDPATGAVTTPPIDGRPVAVDARPDGAIVVLTDDGVLHLLDGTTFRLDGAVDVGF